ncbi:MAG: DNA polymerase subunit beta [Chloroflexota bacterium]|nr:MAG: DNA polymerase subunit beta [Chloroflexota bacterium]
MIRPAAHTHPRGRISVITDRGPTLEEVRARRQEILQIAARHGARNVRVFGSVARGEAGPGSDVDFVVELEPPRGVLDLGELILDLEALLGRAVDVIEIRRPSPTAERILREAVPL